MGDWVPLLSRWVHILSAIFLFGGILFARLVLRGRWTDEMAAAFRPWAMRAGAGVLVTGIYNLLQKSSTPAPYHAVFGVKFLLALHVIAIAAMLGRPGIPEEKRSRWIAGVTYSGLAITLLSAWLRWISR